MPQTNTLTESGYTKLVKDVRRLIEEGRQRAKQAVGRELIETYWQVGKRIKEEKLTSRAGYDESVMEDLSRDLGIDIRTLRRAVIFFELYRGRAPRGPNLTWSHYRELINVKDTDERRFYEGLAAREKWTRDKLVRAIREGRASWILGREAKSKAKGRLRRPREATYVYKALVERVIDGDTLILRIDLGFTVWKEQRIRLAEIDCEPIDTPLGRRAYEYVRDTLAKVPFVMVKTHKIDIYGRYMGHVFYSTKGGTRDKVFSSGRYLNQDLLDAGLAKKV